MKAVVINDFGGIEQLKLVDLKKPEPKEGEVLVHIKATSVNPVDYKIREGKFKGRTPHNFPVILGWDVAGIIEDRGHGTRRYEVGEEVWAYIRRPEIGEGSYAEYVCLPESYLSNKPANLSFEESATIPLVGLTAYQSLFDAGKLHSGQTVLITGASGGVGSMAVQLAKNIGAKVIGVASRKNKDYVKNILGADDFIDYTSNNFADSVTEKVDLVFDTVGGNTLETAPKILKDQGRVVSIAGKLDKEKVKNTFNTTFVYVFVEPHSKQLDQLRDLVEKGMLKPHLQNTFKLEDIKKAHELIETGHTTGKIAITI